MNINHEIRNIIVSDNTDSIEAKKWYLDSRADESRLQSVYIPDTIQWIGDNTFRNCTHLRVIKEEGYEVNNLHFQAVEYIGSNAFSNCDALYIEKLDIRGSDKSLVTIGEDAFYCCKILELNLSSFSGGFELGAGAFDGSHIRKISLTGTAMLSILPDYVFRDNDFEEIEFPSFLTQIGHYAFCCCKNLRSITIPASVTEIGEGCFRGCETLRSVTILAPIKELPKAIFKDCKALEEVVLPDTIEVIREEAFYGCDHLQTITLPKHLKELEPNSIAHCAKLKSLELPEGFKKFKQIGGDCPCLKYLSLPLSLKEGEEFGSSMKKLTVGGSIVKLPYGLFQYCDMESLLLPDTVLTISSNILWHCSKLKHVRLPKHLKVIPSGLFSSCHLLEYVEMPTDLEVIEDRAFQGCAVLKTIELPKSMKEIGECAFMDCKSLRDINLPLGVTLKTEVFANCSRDLLKQIREQPAFKAQSKEVRKILSGSFLTKYGTYLMGIGVILFFIYTPLFIGLFIGIGIIAGSLYVFKRDLFWKILTKIS